MNRGRLKLESREQAEKAKALKEEKNELFRNRYLFIKRPENLTEEEKQKRERLINKHPVLGIIVACMVAIYNLFDSKTYEEALQKYVHLISSEYATNQYTKGMVAKIKEKDKFEKTFVHLRLGISERTLNPVERQNRWLRQIQKSCNKLRAKETIQNRIDAEREIKLERKRREMKQLTSAVA